MIRKLVPSSSPYAATIGFSRAVRVGNFVCVGGTAPIGEDGKTVGVGDPAAQTHRCFQIIEQALAEAGGSMSDVVRSRILLTRIGDWKAVAQVRAEYLRKVKPVDTVMEVSRFIDPDWLIEVEVDAILGEGR